MHPSSLNRIWSTEKRISETGRGDRPGNLFYETTILTYEASVQNKAEPLVVVPKPLYP